MIVYADVIFIVNFFTDYIIAFSVSKATFISTSKKRLVFSSLLGGLYSVFMFEKRLSFLYNSFSEIIFSFLIISIAFKIRNLKGFLTLLLNYYIVAFAVCGTGIFINYYFGAIKMRDGFFYLQNNIILLIPAAIITCAVLVYILKIANRKSICKSRMVEIEIIIENKSVNVTGIMDTGNLLLDPVTLYPVAVVYYDSIKDILPDGISKFFEKEDDLNSVINRKYIGKIRLIPYTDVSGNSVLKGFKPDRVIIKNDDNRVVNDVVIAVSYKKLSENSEFSAILNPQI